MKKKKFSEERFEKMYNEMLDGIGSGKQEYPEMAGFVDWLEDLQENLMQTVGNSLKSLPDECKNEGFIEATMTGIGRFVCVFLEKLQRGGFVSEGVDIYDCFTEVLLPICHKLVVREFDEIWKSPNRLAAIAILNAIHEGKMTDEEIFDKYVKSRYRNASRKEYLAIIREEREKCNKEKMAN